MITLLKRPRRWKDGTFDIAFVGKTSDTKPTKEYERMKIANGSTFFTMDDLGLFFYDKEQEDWRKEE